MVWFTRLHNKILIQLFNKYFLSAYILLCIVLSVGETESQLKPTSSLPFRSLCPSGERSQGKIQGNKKILGSDKYYLENKQNDKIERNLGASLC